MTRTMILRLFALVAIVAGALHPAAFADVGESGPNIVVIFIDDLGYGDVRPFGDPAYATPHLDRLAREGRAFTDFHVPSPVCSASRAALLTGCYPRRVGIAGALGPNAKVGIAQSEITLAEVCKSRGYATACVGKWHLGHQRAFLPLQHGFDEYLGLPYSNDMWPLHPDLAKLSPEVRARREGYPDLPMIEGNEIIDPQVTAEDQSLLTKRYTERAVRFIRQNREKPFLLYLAHSMVHVPLYASEEFLGKSGKGLFGDCMSEIDWSVGQVLNTLDELGLSQQTLVIFTSDNGPWLSYGDHAGNAGPLREGKGTSFEGGVRVPMIARWPGRIAAGSTCDELATTMDLLPTVAALIGAQRPKQTIDGHDIRPLLDGVPEIQSPYEAFALYYAGHEMQAIRDRRFKLVFPHQYNSLNGRSGGKDGIPARYESLTTELALYDLKSDLAEGTNVADQFPEAVARLSQHAERLREELGDKLQGKFGSAIRGPGRVD